MRTFCAVSSAVFLVVIGILHGIVNVSTMVRAVGRGTIPAHLALPAVANAAFSGIAMAVFGLLVFVALPGLRAGERQAGRVVLVIGIVVSLIGAIGFAYSPKQPSVLIFLFFGLLLLVSYKRPPAS